MEEDSRNSTSSKPGASDPPTDVHDVAAEVVDNTAIVWSRITLTAVVRGADAKTEFTTTEVYQRQGTDWKLLALTFSSVRNEHQLEVVADGCGEEHAESMTLVTPTIQRWLDEGRRDPDGLWERAAHELPWFRTWDRVFEWESPRFAGSSAPRRTSPTTRSTTTCATAGRARGADLLQRAWTARRAPTRNCSAR